MPRCPEPEQGEAREGVHPVARVDGLGGAPLPPDSIAPITGDSARLNVVVNFAEIMNKLGCGGRGESGLEVPAKRFARGEAKSSERTGQRNFCGVNI